MPVYEYRCSGGHHYERTEGFDAPSEHACVACGQTARRQISLPAVIFKGSGFYSTDNRKNSSRNGGSDSSETAAERTTTSSEGQGQTHEDGPGPSQKKSEPKAEAAAE